MNERRLVISLMITSIFFTNYMLWANTEEKFGIKDIACRDITIPRKVNRIVAIGPGALRLVVYLNSFDKVAGVEEAEKGKWPIEGRPYTISIQAKVKEIPAIGEGGPGRMPDFERLMIVKPDLLFVIGMEISQVNNMEKRTRVPAVVLNYGEIGVFREEAMESLRLLGKILNKEKRAEEIINFINGCRKDLENRVKGVDETSKSKVYVGGIGYKGSHGITSTEAHYPPLEMLKAKNVVNEIGKSGHLFIDKERLLMWAPDVIFIDTNGFGLINDDYSKNLAFYHNLRAIQNNRVYSVLPYNYYNTNIEVAFADAYYIGKVLYPDRFKDIDPVRKTDEIFKFFMGVNAYPTMKGAFKGFGKVSFGGGKMDVR
jgi:iron complex transport system substrate-binding protein